MQLAVRDVKSEVVYSVDAGGAVLGRERARTDINFRDEAISKRHARIFLEEGVWYIEDLGSSNGTFVHDQPVSEPTPLTPGTTFSLAQRTFEVMHVEGASEAPASSPSSPPSPEGAEPAPSAGLGAVLLAVPKAVAFYLGAVPLFVVNPLGAARRLVEAQRWPALAPAELAAYGLVAGAVTSLMGALFGLVAGAINGALSLGGLVAVLPTVGLGAALGAAGGFLVHPVLGWLVRLFKGASTPRSRTNFALGFYALAILASAPTGLGVVIGALGVPFAALVPALLSLAISLLMVFLAHRWALAFGVVKGVRVFLVAAGGVALLAGGANAVRIILQPTPDDAGSFADGSQEDLRKMRDQARARAGEDAPPDEVEPTNGASSEASPEAPAEADGGGRPAPDEASEGPTPSEAPPEAAAEPASSPEPSEDPSSAERSSPPPGAEVLSAEHPRGMTDYATHRARLRAIERAIDDDPELLDRRDVLDDYRPILRTTQALERRWRRIMRGEPAWKREKILKRKRDYQIYERTKRHVDGLYRTLFEAP